MIQEGVKNFRFLKESEWIYLKILDYPNLLKFNFKNGKLNSINISKEILEYETPLIDGN